jgi:hypothetical protein
LIVSVGEFLGRTVSPLWPVRVVAQIGSKPRQCGFANSVAVIAMWRSFKGSISIEANGICHPLPGSIELAKKMFAFLEPRPAAKLSSIEKT